jgi:ParB-like chromosome segregation protein Spo0J
MTNYKIHALCEIFPQMSEEEFRDLVADIQAHGQLDPIWVYDNVVLDGKNRLAACEGLGIEPVVREWQPKPGPQEPQIAAFILSKNIYRRNLNVSQRAMITAELVTTSGKGRPAENTAVAVISQSDAAQAAGVSVDAVQHANAVLKKGSTTLIDAVRTGKVTGSDAAKIIYLPKPKQTRAVKAVASGAAKTVAAAVGRPRPMKSTPNGKPRGTVVDEPFGKLVRGLDVWSKLRKCQNGRRHKACLNHLDVFWKEWKAWEKEIADELGDMPHSKSPF